MLGRGRAANPQWIAQEFAKAVEFAATGQHERARDQYARIARRLASAPDDQRHHLGQALLGEAESILAMGIFTDAMPRFREAFSLLDDPSRQMPRWLLRQFAEERMQAEDGGLDALTMFLRALPYGTEPGDEETAVRAVRWLQLRCLSGTLSQREATAKALMATLPGVDWPVLALTAALRRDGRVTEAEALLAPVVARGSGDLWFRWGIQLSTLLRYDEAIAAYDEAMRRGPGPASPWSRGHLLHAESLLFRGLAQHQMGRTRQADADLRRASAVAPQDPRIHYSLGRLAVQLGAEDEAWSHFTTALMVESGFAPARLGLGLLRELAGRPAEAVSHYQAAAFMDPSLRAARVRLGAVMLAAGSLDDADAVLRPETGESYWGNMAAFHYGLTRLRVNDPIRALGVWERVHSSDLREWTALAHDREARNRLATDPTAARLRWQLALLDAPDVEERRTALREASLREAATLVLTGRDLPESRRKAEASLTLAGSLPGSDGPGRHDRLRAMIDLAGGSAEHLDRLLDPPRGLRDRCHLAAAALLGDRPGQAAAMLAELDPGPDCDPAVARLRALLAEREERWPDAVRWHQRFLRNDVDGSSSAELTGDDHADAADTDTEANTLVLDVLAITKGDPSAATPNAGAPETPCTTAVGGECAEPSTGACGGCGREGCAAHLYRPAAARTFRCERCAGPALQSVLYCARRAGTPGEAETTLASWAEAMDGNPIARSLRRQVAFLRAEDGDLDGALDRLPDDADGDRVVLLIRRAAGAVDRGEPYRALGDLRQALRLEPGQPQAVAALDALAEYEARQHAVEGRHQEAFDGYLALVRDDPANPRLLHALGLTSHHLARSSGSPEHWRWAIGCLVSALSAPGFAPAAKARRALIDQLRGELREADEAAGRTGDDVDSWTLRLGMDLFACEVSVPEDDGGEAGLVASPALDRLLRQQPETPALAAWREGADRLHTLDDEASRDRVLAAALFGPFGPHHYLYEDARYAAAVVALDAVADAERDGEWAPLLRKALVMRGMELHLDDQWPDALACIARAVSLAPGEDPDSVLVEMATESGLNAAEAVLKAREDDWQGVIDLLETAITVAPEDPALRAELGAAHTARATVEVGAEATDYVQALAHVRRALELLPDDPAANRLLVVVLAERAGLLTRPGPDGDLLEAVQWWQELIEIDPDPAYRTGLSRVLRLLACSAALAGRRSLALDRMAWGLLADPEWSGDAEAEAPRRIAAQLIVDAMEDVRGRPFEERAHRLRTATAYRDSPELRDLMIAAWRNEAIIQFDSRHYGVAATLLEETLRLYNTAPPTANGHDAFTGRPDAVHWRRYPQARSLLKRTVRHFPDDDELRELQARIDDLR